MLVALLVAVYLRAIRILRRRGREIPRSQQGRWYGGVALLGFAFCGPPGALSNDLLSAHMAEHLLLADIAAPLLLAGARTPVLVFLLPRDILVPLARTKWLRRFFRLLRKPLVSVPIWIVTLDR